VTVYRRFAGGRLVLASHNPGKVREIADLLRPFAVEVVSAGTLGLPEPEETGTTFEANAELKARAAAQASGLPALADDSGLAVAALGGEPGVQSARWAGEERDFGRAMDLVRRELEMRDPEPPSGQPAKFVCVLCIAWPDGHIHLFRGEVAGTLTFPPRGDRGFGYDPIFVPEGHDVTFGEMEPQAKHAISHRAQAFARLIDACFKPVAPPPAR
jgi:XTP/dITP diphosphohydrolase